MRDPTNVCKLVLTLLVFRKYTFGEDRGVRELGQWEKDDLVEDLELDIHNPHKAVEQYTKYIHQDDFLRGHLLSDMYSLALTSAAEACHFAKEWFTIIKSCSEYDIKTKLKVYPEADNDECSEDKYICDHLLKQRHLELLRCLVVDCGFHKLYKSRDWARVYRTMNAAEESIEAKKKAMDVFGETDATSFAANLPKIWEIFKSLEAKTPSLVFQIAFYTMTIPKRAQNFASPSNTDTTRELNSVSFGTCELKEEVFKQLVDDNGYFLSTNGNGRRPVAYADYQGRRLYFKLMPEFYAIERGSTDLIHEWVSD